MEPRAHDWVTGLREEKGPLLPCNIREGNQFAGLGAVSCGKFHSYGFYLVF